MHALAVVSINLHTKLNVPSSIHSEDMVVAPKLKNGSHDSHNAFFKDGFVTGGLGICYGQPIYQI